MLTDSLGGSHLVFSRSPFCFRTIVISKWDEYARIDSIHTLSQQTLLYICTNVDKSQDTRRAVHFYRLSQVDDACDSALGGLTWAVSITSRASCRSCVKCSGGRVFDSDEVANFESASSLAVDLKEEVLVDQLRVAFT